MEKEINSVLNFYTCGNKLKTSIIDDKNDYSNADHIYGSMILAMAIDSEFSESDNVAKILRMILLSNFSRINSEYDIKNSLKKGQQFYDEIVECEQLRTKDSKLAFKYRLLDLNLTNLIKNNEGKLSYFELQNEAMKFFTPRTEEEYVKCVEIFKFYYLNFTLKDKVRSGWDKTHWNVKTDRLETISEHIVSAMLLALATDSEFEYSTKGVNIDEVLKTLSLHEIGECIIGDITPFDGITPEEKEEIEHNAMKDALSGLTKKKELLNMLFSFDSKESNNSKIAYYCDKMDADLQAKIYEDSGLHRTLDDQKDNCVFNSLKVQDMIKNGAKTAFDIWYLWDYPIYTKFSEFPEFLEVLDTAQKNNLLES